MNKKISNKSILKFILYLFIYLLLAFLVIINLRTNYIGGDDPFTLAISRHSFSSIIGLTAQDVHPFLYYYLVRIFILPFKNTFTQIISMKILSAIPYLILLIIGNTTIKKHFSDKAALIFMFSMITMPTIIENVWKTRMYGWVMLFTTVMFLLLLYMYKGLISNSLGNFSWITLLALASAYTHYYGLITVFFIYIIFFLIFKHEHKNIKYLSISAMASLLLYLPWVQILWKQVTTVHGNYYSNPLTLTSTIEQFKDIILSMMTNTTNSSLKAQIILFGMIIFTLFMVIKYIHVNATSLPLYVGLFLPFLLILIGFSISILVKHQVLFSRYLIPTMGICWLSLSIMLASLLRDKNIYSILKMVLVLVVLLVGLKSYHFEANQLKSYIQLFNQTRQLINKLPKKNYIMTYNNPNVAQQLSVYVAHHDSYYLGNTYGSKPLDTTSVYEKVFDNLHINSKVPINNKGVLFVKTTQNIGQDKLSTKFYNKYRNKLTKVGTIYTPLCASKSIVYKLN